jgi:hypothetical protein
LPKSSEIRHAKTALAGKVANFYLMGIKRSMENT